jgi:hypothetical protein
MHRDLCPRRHAVSAPVQFNYRHPHQVDLAPFQLMQWAKSFCAPTTDDRTNSKQLSLETTCNFRSAISARSSHTCRTSMPAKVPLPGWHVQPHWGCGGLATSPQALQPARALSETNLAWLRLWSARLCTAASTAGCRCASSMLQPRAIKAPAPRPSAASWQGTTGVQPVP